jgi:hypothetical protein
MYKTNLALRDNFNNLIGLSRSWGFLALAVDNIGLRDINSRSRGLSRFVIGQIPSSLSFTRFISYNLVPRLDSFTWNDQLNHENGKRARQFIYGNVNMYK